MQNRITSGGAAIIPFPGTITPISSQSSAVESNVVSLTEQIARDKPRVKLANAILTSSTSCTVNELAKLLKQNGVDIGQNRLYQRLRSDGYLCRRNNIRNLPTQTAMNSGYFEVKETPFTTWHSVPKTNRTVLVTAKGLGHFIDKYLSENGGGEL